MNDYYAQLINLKKTAGFEKINYPMLIWSDQNDKSELFLVTSETNIKHINEFKGGNIHDLYDQISRISGARDVLEAAWNGDETTYPVDMIEFADDALDWTPMFADIKNAIERRPEMPEGLTTELLLEMENNFREDVVAAVMDSVYSSIIYYIARIANELSVNSIGIVGELALNERFRTLIIKTLNEKYEIRFSEEL